MPEWNINSLIKKIVNKTLKLFLLYGLLICLSGSVLAIMLFQFSSQITTFAIISEGELSVSQEFSSATLNTTENAASIQDDMLVLNANGLKLMNISISETKISTDSNCPDYVNDCSSWIKLNDVLLNESVLQNITSGVNRFVYNLSCLQYACGQNISVQINGTGI